MTLNVFGDPIISCCNDPLTGYFRDGFCNTASSDHGTHIVCAVMTEDFLRFTKSRGNDLTTPMPHWKFPGLVPGDKWCLCISRWMEAEKKGKAPLVVLEATHSKALQFVSLETLKKYEFQEQ